MDEDGTSESELIRRYKSLREWTARWVNTHRHHYWTANAPRPKFPPPPILKEPDAPNHGSSAPEYAISHSVPSRTVLRWGDAHPDHIIIPHDRSRSHSRSHSHTKSQRLSEDNISSVIDKLAHRQGVGFHSPTQPQRQPEDNDLTVPVKRARRHGIDFHSDVQLVEIFNLSDAEIAPDFTFCLPVQNVKQDQSVKKDHSTSSSPKRIPSQTIPSPLGSTGIQFDLDFIEATSISLSQSSIDTIVYNDDQSSLLSLSASDAQLALDAMWKLLELSLLPEASTGYHCPAVRNRLRRATLKGALQHNILPTALFVRGVQCKERDS